MRFYVPEIGDTLWLAEDWSFPLYEERRNDTLLSVIVPNYKETKFRNWRERRFNEAHSCVMPAGTELIVARVYIRNGASDYSSLTFRIGHCEHKAWRKKRFWAKLSDVNRIEFVNHTTVK